MAGLVADPVVEYMTPEEIAARIERVKSDMVAAARRTEFIVAAQLRDELIKLQDIYDGIKGKPAAVAADIKDEMERLGWEQADVIIFSGDAYVDHPSFGAAVIAVRCRPQVFKVAIVPQPNWRDDLRDFRKTRPSASVFRSFRRCDGFDGEPLYCQPQVTP